MSYSRADEPKLIFPALAGFYETAGDLWYPMIRIVAGGLLYIHVWPKLVNGPAAVAVGMTKQGWSFPVFFAYAAIFLETIGATCVVLGLATRFFAAAIAIELAFITFGVMAPKGWSNMEPNILWGIILFAIALRGGGPYSLDRLIGKEL
jgi:putative oxidoreductase